MTLTEILEPARQSEREFTITVPDGWQQGRGAFGGLIFGALVRCLEQFETEPERTLRSLTAQLAGPVLPGEWTVSIESLRRGNAVSTVRASLLTEESVLAEATATLGRSRSGTPAWQEISAPSMPPWRDLPIADLRPPVAPAFTQHLEYRLAAGAPFSSGVQAYTSGWVRPKEAGPHRGPAYLAAMIDSWYPAGLVRFDEPRPAATMTFTAELIGTTDGLDHASPLFFVGRTPVAEDGYMVEFRELWGEDGRLLALNQQTIAIIKGALPAAGRKPRAYHRGPSAPPDRRA